jgi:cytochrome oxidase Cu insertion factor (SCO1/SenC/PrrC family)
MSYCRLQFPAISSDPQRDTHHRQPSQSMKKKKKMGWKKKMDRNEDFSNVKSHVSMNKKKIREEEKKQEEEERNAQGPLYIFFNLIFLLD